MDNMTENNFRFFEYDKKEAALTTTEDGLIFFEFSLRRPNATLEARAHCGDRSNAGAWLVLGARDRPLPTLQLLIDFATATHNNKGIVEKLRRSAS